MLNQSFSMKLSKVIPLGFLTIVSVMVINSIFSKLTVNTLTSTAGGVMDSYRVQTSVQELQEILVDIQLGERGFIITRNEEFLEPYNNAKNKLNEKFAEAKKLVKEDPSQTKRLNELEELSQETIDVLTVNIGKIRKGFTPSLAELKNGKQSLEVLRSKVEEILNAESELLLKRQKSVKDSESFSTLTSLGGIITGTVLGLLIILFVIRKVVKPLDEVTNVINSSSTEIAATVAQQERIASQQAASVSQTTTTMDELGASSRTSSEQAELAANGAREALALVDGSNAQENFSRKGATSLKDKVTQITEQILHLSEQTNQIGSISSLVSDLANQTNMLALNAAVEAVRAGEHGKGFAVVAAEIRKLADQSKKSAERINALVMDIKNATNSTVLVTDEGRKTVDNVVNAINNIAVNTQQISLTAKQQAVAIQQVVEAMNTINVGASETASGITQTKSGVQKLNDAALNLKAVV